MDMKMEYGWKRLKSRRARRRGKKEDSSPVWGLVSILLRKSRSPQKGRGGEQGRAKVE